MSSCKCRRCNIVELAFSSDMVSFSGKLIPLDARTMQPHKCIISSPFECRDCGQLLYTDHRIRSRNEKLIPLDYNTKEPHNCPGSPFPRKFSKGGI